MIRQFEERIYDKNKKIWFETNIGELHHTCGRTGARLAAYCLFKAGPAQHHSNPAWIKEAREKNREKERILIKENYRRGQGCLKERFPACRKCAMPKLGGTE